MTDYVLAIDHGTSGIKAAVVSARGEVMDFEFEATPMNFLPNGGAEQDPEQWWQALVGAAGRLVERRAVEPSSIRAVCVSSTFSSTVAVDADGRALIPSLTWMDSRGAPHVKRLMGGLPSYAGYNLVKAFKWLRKTAGAPALSGKDDAAHVLFVKHELPEVYSATSAFMPSKDYLNLRLTGKIAASYDSMQLFWASDIRDPNDVHYDSALLDLLGIDAAKLPPMRASTAVLGPLTAQCASLLGLGPDVKVVMGSPDHQCALVGSGAVNDYAAHLYIGTSSWIECIVPFMKSDPLHSIATFPTALPGKYQCINEQDLAGGALGFLADNVILRRNRLFEAAEPERPYALLDEIAAGVEPGSGKLLFTPWLNGERTPVDDTSLRGGFHNLSTTSNLDHMVRAVLEGVAYNTRWALTYVERFTKRRLDPIRIVGGGGQSRLWCQIFADVLGREIHRVKDPLQANARGAGLIAAVGMGWTNFEDIGGLIEIDEVFSPAAKNQKIYNELFEVFLMIHRRNRAIYRRLNS